MQFNKVCIHTRMNTINYSRGSEGGSLTICGDPWPDSNVGNGDPVTYEVTV